MTLTDVAQPRSRSTGFRADLQGLRAVAVTLVVVYHTGYALPGGFVGVDVFFVLSGFLIIGLLDREAERTGRIDLRRFFARRARRLLPALALVTTVTVLASTMLVELGDSLRSVARTAAGASLFVANLVLYRDADYFAPDAERNPLLHTWSLSVEEQFYFVVPVALVGMLALHRAGRTAGLSRRTGWMLLLGVGSIASLVINVALVDLGGRVPGFEDPVSLAFYAPVTRAWQFGLGGLLVLALTRSGRPRSLPGLRPLGLAAIVASALLLDPSAAFPGVRAVLPTVGTLMMLLPGPEATGRSRGPLLRALESRPLVVTGDISYSWYLWHWPAIVLGRAAFGDGALTVWVAVVASFGLAMLSTRTVEDRFRSDAQLLGMRAVRLAVISVGMPLVVALVVGSLNERVAERVGLGQGARPWSISDCFVPREPVGTWPRERCIRGGASDAPDRAVDVLLIGDSHADSLAEGLLEAAQRLGLSVGSWTVEGQPPVGDSPWTARFLELVAEERPKVVVIGNRSSNELDDENITRWTDRAVSGDEAAALWGQTVRQGVIDINDLGAHVIWVLNVPEFPGGPVLDDAVPTLLRPTVRARTIGPEALAERRGLAVPAEAAALSALEGVTVIEPADVLCRPDCRNADADAYLYYDSHHLSVVGSRLLTDVLEQALREAVGR